jgi:osmotically inducible lipoprotein OsmB
MWKAVLAVSSVVALLIFGGCSGMSSQQQRTLSGGALGAGAGSIVGLLAGNPSLGAAIGGGAGLLAGMLIPDGDATAQPQVQYEPPPVYREPPRYPYPQPYPDYGARRPPPYRYPRQKPEPCYVCVPGRQW